MSHSEFQGSRNATICVLVIDDSVEERDRYHRYLGEDSTYQILEAETVAVGVELWTQAQPDLVLLSDQLPDGDGFAALTALQQASCQLEGPWFGVSRPGVLGSEVSRLDLPVIVLTGQRVGQGLGDRSGLAKENDEAIALQWIQRGAQDCLSRQQMTATSLRLAMGRVLQAARLRSQLHQRMERERLVSEMTRKLHQSLELSEILETTVREVRRFLQTDRVVIFQLQSKDQGKILTESVGPGWMSLLDQNYTDPCLSRSYIEPFRQGLITRKVDIYDGSIDDCHVKLLEQLQVRANLVVPILQHEYLWGLLIVHHCSGPRPWQSLEVELLQDLSTHLGIALQQAELYQQVQSELSERKQSELATSRSEQRIRQILNSLFSFVGVLTPSGILVEANRTALEAADLSLEDVVGKPFEQTYWWSYSLELQEELRQAIGRAASGEMVRYDAAVRVRDGQLITIDFTIMPVRNEAGEVEYLIPSGIDISERQQTEMALRQSRSRYQALFDSIDEGFSVIKMLFDEENNPLDYCFLEINPAFEAQTGLKNAVGKTARQLLPDLEDFWFETYSRVALTGIPTRFENGSASLGRWFDVYACRIGEPQEREVAIVFKDISDRKRAEEEREQFLAREQAAREAAEAANRVKDEFLAVVSHELRTPLNPILGWASLLRSRQLPQDKHDRALETIERNAKVQAQLIDDLLDVSRILRGKLSLERIPVDMVAVVHAAMETLQLAADAKNIRIQTYLDMELQQTGCQIFGDAGRLQQVVWNLLSNAVKFTPQGGRVEIRLGQEHGQLQLMVQDTGKGIAAEFLPHVFDRFRQAESSSTRQFGGLGLGLAIVRYLVELHGGSITAASPGEGQGSTFTVLFPLMPQQRSPSSPVLAEAKLSLDLKGLRILVVDDDESTREFMRYFLQAYGAEVLVEDSAIAALETLKQHRPDILLSDIGMPEMDGYTLMQRVRSLPVEQGGGVVAIALTAYAREMDYRRAMEAGFQQHLSKPVEPEKLVGAIVQLTRGV